MNEPCLIWMIHVSYEWAMSHMNKPCLIWMSHVTYEWAMSYMTKLCHVWMSHVSYEWVMSHMNEPCLIWRLIDMRHDSSWLIDMRHDSSMRDMTHSYVQPHLAHATSEERGCRKSQVSFRQRATSYRAFVRKETYKDLVRLRLTHAASEERVTSIEREWRACDKYRAHFGDCVQPIAFGVSFNLILQSQFSWSLFNRTWQKFWKHVAKLEIKRESWAVN